MLVVSNRFYAVGTFRPAKETLAGCRSVALRKLLKIKYNTERCQSGFGPRPTSLGLGMINYVLCLYPEKF